jgi:FKBP-type peptidyl-prolyl cis-trans isomerase
MYLLRRLLFLGLCLVPLALLTAACGGNNNNPNAPSGPAPQGPADLQITDLTVGTGADVVNNKVVAVTYILWRYDPSGTDFKGEGLDQSSFQFRTGTGAVVPGFEQGLLGMKVNGTRRLIIPPSLAYGTAGYPSAGIRSNEWLVYEVGILAVSD